MTKKIVIKNKRQLESMIKSKYGQNAILSDKKNEEHIYKILNKAGNDLKDLLEKGLQAYYTSYFPNRYDRSYKTLWSVRIGQPLKKTPDRYELRVIFDEDSSMHPSVLHEKQPQGYTPWLLQAGWRTKNDSKWNIDRFTRFEGTNFITKAVQQFNAEHKYDGLEINIVFNNRDVTGVFWSYGKPV